MQRAKLRDLEFRHRVEELCERFGVQIRWASSTEATVSCPGVSPAQLRAAVLACRKPSVNVGEAGLHLVWRDGIEAVEEALLAVLGHLLARTPLPFLDRGEQGIAIPRSPELPESSEYLERYYGANASPREKKPPVVDLRASQGAFLCSIDRDRLRIVDAASQIATLPAGFRADALQVALDAGRFDPHVTSAHLEEAEEVSNDHPARLLADALLRHAPPGLGHVTFLSSGAEANEKALHLAKRHGPGGRRVVAFQGGFHGRTLLALMSTWAPLKRQGYEIEGFQTHFIPYPASLDHDTDPPAPPGWVTQWSKRQPSRQALLHSGDELLGREVASLCAAEALFRGGDILACIVEPFQAEGGDNPATPRFYNGLRALTRAYQIPLIFDEVQAGFALSGRLWWQERFRLQDAAGRADPPDLVTCAKRAQVGIVLSRWPDPNPSPGHAASLLRGLIHLEIVSQTPPGLESYVRVKLKELEEAWPAGMVSRGRVAGDAFAFDLASKQVLDHLVAQRFYQGYMVYPAGERSLRFRLHRAMTTSDVDLIFAVIQRSLAALLEQAGGAGEDLIERMQHVTAPRWAPPASDGQGPLCEGVDKRSSLPFPRQRGSGKTSSEAASGMPACASMTPLGTSSTLSCLGSVRVRRLEGGAGIRGLAALSEPEAIVRPVKELVEVPGTVLFVAENEAGPLGYALACPWRDAFGPEAHLEAPMGGEASVLFCAAVVLAKHAEDPRVALELLGAQIQHALSQEGYAYLAGECHREQEPAVWQALRRLGAYSVRSCAGVSSYRVPLKRHDRRRLARPQRGHSCERVYDFASGIADPTGASHPLLERARDLGVFDEATLTKLTLSQFITRAWARYAEYLRAVAPRGLEHLYLTSSRDEMVDKGLRVLKHKRPQGRIAVGIAGGYLGQITAVARSLTDWGAAQPDHTHFGWPLVPHPSLDAQGCVVALDQLVTKYGTQGLLGLFVEAVQERSGEVLSAGGWEALQAWRQRTGVPLVLAETTTGRYRSGRGMWWADAARGEPDMVLWWGGGQLGHIFCNDEVYVDKPLTFVSTWDGDELSATRSLWQLYACREALVGDRAQELQETLDVAGFAPGEALGLGLYRVLRLEPARCDHLKAFLRSQWQVHVARVGPDRLALAPPITVNSEAIIRLRAGLLAWRELSDVLHAGSR